MAHVLADPYPWLRMVLGDSLHPGGERATLDLLRAAGVGPGDRLLDVGCGAGVGLRLGRSLGAEAVGVDAVASGDGIVCADMAELPFGDAQFDVVLAECVVCLAAEPEAALRAFRRVVRPRGRLALSDMIVDDPLDDVPVPLRAALCLDGQRDVASLRARVRGAGFDIVQEDDRSSDVHAMRDAIRQRVDIDGMLGALGPHAAALRRGVAALGSALDAGRIGYVSIVATARPET